MSMKRWFPTLSRSSTLIGWLLLAMLIAIPLGNVTADAEARHPRASRPVDAAATADPPQPDTGPAASAGGSGADSTVYLPIITSPSADAWPMAAANPQRTSWTTEEIRGNLKPLWFKPIEPYILPRVQIIAAQNTLFIATARGLYALDAGTGGEKWVYPTEMPLGHSPTVAGGVVYVGGFDRQLHAIDAATGAGLWTFAAEAGFDTNPLVVGGLVYAGNRDGNLYAIHAAGPQAGQLAWEFGTDGPIHYSAAYDQGVIYFASNDGHAYALDAQTGGLIWKSAQLPGHGFHSWWPVVHEDYVILAGSNNYPVGKDLGPGSLHDLDRDTVYPNNDNEPTGTLAGTLGTAPGDWAPGTPTIDMSKSSGTTMPVTEYFETYPWRRTYFVLDRNTGVEYTSDFDADGEPEYAPILWFSAKGSGNRYPPMVGGDGVLYQTNNFMSDNNIAGGHVSGWMPGTPYISAISMDWGAVDEPHAYTGGGDLIYWSLCCDRQAGSIDISMPNVVFADNYNAGILPPTSGGDSTREWSYFGYNLHEILPGYNDGYFEADGGVYGAFGGPNGMYGYHGDQNPPIPFRGRVYLHRSNSIIAFGPGAGNPVELPMAQTVPTQDEVPNPTQDELAARLTEEVEKIIAAGHLRPGFATTGIFDVRGRAICGDNLTEYYHHPGDTLYTLLRALPHLPSDLQQQTRNYLQSEFNAFPPHEVNHIGFQDGASREAFGLPPEIEADMATKGPEGFITNFEGWDFNPHFFYALWKYAQEFGGAQAIFDQAKSDLPAVPSDSILLEFPHAQNAFIAGYLGYLELEALAGYPETASVRNQLNAMLALRASAFTPDPPDSYYQVFQKYYCRTLNASRNYLYLVPELANYLRANAYGKVQNAIEEYDRIAPYWFVSRSETTFAEGILMPLHDPNAIFHARAWIMQTPQSDLLKYLDVPTFPVGDLYYIQNLVTALESAP